MVFPDRLSHLQPFPLHLVLDAHTLFLALLLQLRIRHVPVRQPVQRKVKIHERVQLLFRADQIARCIVAQISQMHVPGRVQLMPGLGVVLHRSHHTLRLLPLLDGRFGDGVDPNVVSLPNFALDGNE